MYRLGVIDPIEEDGVIFYRLEAVDDDGIESVKVYIVDDKNIAQPTLAKRRLVLLANGAKMKRMNNAIFFVGDLVKLAKPHVWFIDSLGKLFKYRKTMRALLIFRKIKKLIPILSGGMIIEVEGLAFRFKTLHSPNTVVSYAGILRQGMTHILYGLYTEEHKETWRVI